MAYAKTFKRNYQQVDNSNDIIFDLGKRKQVTVRKFNNINLVDIREYYIDKATGENRPGKKGISLTEESWNILLENQNKIQSALDKLAGRTTSGSGLAGKLQAIPVNADSADIPPVKKPKKTKKEPVSKKEQQSQQEHDENEENGGLVMPPFAEPEQERAQALVEAKKAKKEKAKKKKEESEEESDFDDIDDLVKELESEED